MSKKVITFYDSEKQAHDFPIVTSDYGVCDTNSDIANKIVTCDDFSLFTGAEITVKFNKAPTTDVIKLNVNDSGAIAVDFSACGNKPSEVIKATGCYGFVYDGTSWIYKGSGKGASKEELERLKYYGDKDIIPSDESYFTVNSTGETITGLTDTGKTQTELVIPYKINGKEIASIGSNAFRACTELTSINIPNSITSIMEGAFSYCAGLISIDIPNSVTSIGNSAFYSSSLTSINIPNNVTSIGSGAFYNGLLTSINIPNNVTSIGYNAFNNSSSNFTIYCEQGSYAETYAKTNNISIVYTAIAILDIETELEKLNYYDNKDIIPSNESYFTVNETGETITGLSNTGKTQTELVIPYKINGVKITSIKSMAFEGCKSLTSITIPNSVTNISGNAFYNCTSLKSITIPNSVTSIEGGAFQNCSSLTSINIPNSVTGIGGGTFYDCAGLSSIDIPNSVTSIGMNAFGQCTSLISINIPSSVKSIGDSAFHVYSNDNWVPIPGLTIYCEQGSYAESYAKTNNIPIMYTDIDSSKYLTKDNTTEFTPISDYQPATKKYVDDKPGITQSQIDKIDSIGNLSDLTTTDKTNMVSAINEVKSNLSTVYKIKGSLDPTATNSAYITDLIPNGPENGYVYNISATSSIGLSQSWQWDDNNLPEFETTNGGTEYTIKFKDSSIIQKLRQGCTLNIKKKGTDEFWEYNCNGRGFYYTIIDSNTIMMAQFEFDALTTKPDATYYLKQINTNDKVPVTKGDNVVWVDGYGWDKLAADVDLSNYYVKTDVNNLLAKKADKQTKKGGFVGGQGASAGTSSNPLNTIQLGAGTNINEFSMQVYDYQLLANDATTKSATDGSKYLKDVGKLSNLKTTKKDNIVNAINDIKDYVDNKVPSGGANASTVTSCTGDELAAITSPTMGSIRYVSAVGTGNNTSITPGLYFYLGSWKKVALEDTAIISNEFVSGGDSTSLK